MYISPISSNKTPLFVSSLIPGNNDVNLLSESALYNSHKITFKPGDKGEYSKVMVYDRGENDDIIEINLQMIGTKGGCPYLNLNPNVENNKDTKNSIIIYNV